MAARWFIRMLWLGLLTPAQGQLSSGLDSYPTNTCLKRSVLVYTSDSSTYVVTDAGTTEFPASATFCSNATTIYGTSTFYGSNQTLPASTVTIYQQAVPTNQVIASTGFEGGSETTSNSSSSSQVTAEVVPGGPLQPYSGDNYLLITFGSSTSVPVRRQVSAGLVYNATQVFPSTAGSSYTLVAYAASAANGNTAPDCSIKICADESCSETFTLTSSYNPYSFNYAAEVSDNSTLATFSVQCSSAAYVALDDIEILSMPGSVAVGTTRTITQFATATQTQTQMQAPTTQVIPITTTQVLTTTAFISGSNVLVTTTVPTVIYSTVTQSILQPAVTQSQTQTQLVPVTTTQVLTTTTLISGSDVVLTTTVPTIIWSTLTQFVTQPAATEYQTVTQVVPITTSQMVERTTTISGTDYTITTAVPTVIYSTIESVQTQVVTENFTLPQATFTPLAETTYITYTLEPPTVTVIVSTTPPAVTETLPQPTYTPPAETLQLTETLPQPTETIQVTETLPTETYTQPPATATATLTLPPETEYSFITETSTSYIVQSSTYVTAVTPGPFSCDAPLYTATDIERTFTPFCGVQVYADQINYISDTAITNPELCAQRCTGNCWMANYYAYSYPPATPTDSYTYCQLNYGTTIEQAHSYGPNAFLYYDSTTSTSFLTYFAYGAIDLPTPVGYLSSGIAQPTPTVTETETTTETVTSTVYDGGIPGRV